MALSLQDQQDIVYYLGWPGKTLLIDSTHYNSVIASRLINLNAPIEEQARTLVARIKEIDCRLRGGALNRVSTLEIDTIKLNPEEIHRLRRERRVIIGELSDLLDVDVIKSSGGSMVNISS